MSESRKERTNEGILGNGEIDGSGTQASNGTTDNSNELRSDPWEIIRRVLGSGGGWGVGVGVGVGVGWVGRYIYCNCHFAGRTICLYLCSISE